MKISPLAEVRQIVADESFLQGLQYGLTGIFSLLISQVQLLGSLSPFAAALTMALPMEFSIASLLGALTGYSLLGSFAENLPYIIALLGMAILKSAVAGFPKLCRHPLFLSAGSTAVLAICLILRNILLKSGTIDLIISLCESLLSGAVTLFSYHAFVLTFGHKRLSESRFVERSSLLMILLIGLLGLCRLQFSLLNLGRIVTVLFLLVTSNRRGAAAGAVCGLTTGAVLTLFNPTFAVTGGLYAVAAMISGVFARFGRLTQIAFFLLFHTLGVLVMGADAIVIAGALDLLVGAAIFLILPRSLLQWVPSVEVASIPPDVSGSYTAARLRFSADALTEMQQAIEAVSQKLQQAEVSSIPSVYDRTVERVCSRCGLKLFCWETSYNQVMDAFQRLTPLLREKESLQKEDLPPHFTTQCAKPDDILRSVNSCYQEYLSSGRAARKVLHAKQVAAEQFQGISSMLSEMSDEMAEMTPLPAPQLQQIREIFRELGEVPDTIYAVRDEADRLRVEVYQSTALKAPPHRIARRLSDLLERPFALPCVTTAAHITRISFFEQAQYVLQFGMSQRNAKDRKISGDCYEFFLDSRGFAHLILSDGMGNGGRAAVDSMMTCSFVLKLLKAGFGFEAALKLINSALLVKAGDESLATLDIACIDLYTGNAEFLKAGAVCSVVVRNGKAMLLEGSSLPLGILQGISYCRQQRRLQNGDLIVMVTDGAVSISPEWLLEEVSLLSQATPQEIAQKLTTLAQGQKEQPVDDITVLAARLVRADQAE